VLESFFRKRLAAQRNASEATIRSYRDALRLLLVFAAEQAGKQPSRLRVEDLDRDVVLAFLDHLEAKRGNSIRTRNARLAAIRSFFRHVAYEDPALMGIAQRVRSIPGKRTVRRVVSYLRKDELDVLLAMPDRKSPKGRRDYALLLFLARTGARVSETVAVNASDLRLEAPCQVLLHGKRSKDRVVPLAGDLVAALRELCDERPIPRNTAEPVFVNTRGTRLSRFGVIHILNTTVSEARIKHPGMLTSAISPHTMRHTTAMHLLQSGVDLTTIQAWLGHASVLTTHHYIEADVEMKRGALAACDHPDAAPSRYQPPDDILALLESL
jgi:site-specific recombinase XerD